MPLALWSSAVMAYARCFGKGKRFGLATEDVKNLPLHGAVMKFHKWILEERDKLTAHAPNPSEAAKVGAALSPPEQKDRRVEGIVIFASSHVLIDDVGVRQLGGLASELAKQTAEKAQEHRMSPEGRPAAEPGQLVPAADAGHLAARRQPGRRRPCGRQPGQGSAGA